MTYRQERTNPAADMMRKVLNHTLISGCLLRASRFPCAVCWHDVYCREVEGNHASERVKRFETIAHSAIDFAKKSFCNNAYYNFLLRKFPALRNRALIDSNCLIRSWQIARANWQTCRGQAFFDP